MKEKNKKKISKPLKITLFSLTGIILTFSIVAATLFLSVFFSTKSKNKPKQVNYSLMETRLIENNSFKKMNNVVYPNGDLMHLIISKDYINSVNNFSNVIYQNREDDNKNYSFSPYNLYSNLNILSLATNKQEINNILDNILGMDKESRMMDFLNVFKNDFYSNEYGTNQMYEGFFATNLFNLNNDFLNSLTKNYVEAYQLNFTNNSDVSKMLKWVDSKIDEKDFLTKDDLGDYESAMFYLFSILYFKNKWMNSFSEKNSRKNSFKISDTKTVETIFMRHQYFGDYYDYGEYCAFYDYYKNGMKIKYLVPNNYTKLNIFDLTKGKNIFIDDENKKYIPIGDLEKLVINLEVPKFKSNYFIDFSNELKSIGLNELFNKESKAFNYVFNDLSEESSVYLDFVKQKNLIDFNEDGTTIKSVTFSMKAGAAAPITGDTIDIKLDCPFIYIIYDQNNIPLYVGNMNDPTL